MAHPSEKRLNFELWGLVLGVSAATFLFSGLVLTVFKHEIPDFFAMWNRWDTPHYMFLAEKGYVAEGEERFFIAFSPLFPAAVRVVSLFFGNFVLSALIVNQLAYIAAAFYLYALAKLDYSHETALRAVLYFSVYPASFILHAGYTDSLFMTGVLGAFYYARRGSWPLAAVMGAMAAMAKQFGVILLLPLAIEALEQSRWDLKKIPNKTLFLGLLVPAAAVLPVISARVHGDPMFFSTVQQARWNMFQAFPWVGLQNTWLFFRSSYLLDQKISVGLAPILCTAMALFFLADSLRTARRSYQVYFLISLLTFICWSFWRSVPRYTLFLFPIFFRLAGFGESKIFHRVWLCFCVFFYGYFLALFLRGWWAF